MTAVEDGAAVGVLLAVQLALFAPGDVAAIDGRIGTLLGAHGVIVGAQGLGLAMGELAVGDPPVDAGVLVEQALVDLGAAGMGLVERLGVGMGGDAEAGEQGGDADGAEQDGS